VQLSLLTEVATENNTSIVVGTNCGVQTVVVGPILYGMFTTNFVVTLTVFYFFCCLFIKLFDTIIMFIFFCQC
jgi:hypothetical protein